MGLSKEEQRAKQRKDRPEDFHPSEKKSKPWRFKRKLRKNGKVSVVRIKKKKPKNTKSNKVKIRVNDRSSSAYKAVMKAARPYQLKLKKNATKPELFFKSVLEERGIGHRFQKIIVYNNNSKFYILDFKIKRVVVELDGNHHYKGAQLKKDLVRDGHLRSLGYKVIRIKNSDLYDNWPRVVKRLRKAGVMI